MVAGGFSETSKVCFIKLNHISEIIAFLHTNGGSEGIGRNVNFTVDIKKGNLIVII